MSFRGSTAHPARICVIGLRGVPGVIGGIESVCESIYPRIAAASPSTTITIVTRSGYSQRRRYVFKGVDVHVLWAVDLWGVGTLIHTFCALIYARVVLTSDLVHLHGIGPAFLSPLAKLLGFIVVVTHHSPDYRRPKWGKYGKFLLSVGERFSAYWADSTVCVSRSVQEDFLRLYPAAANRTHLIRNSAELPNEIQKIGTSILDELGLTQGQYILAVGRLDATKGFDGLISAFQVSNLGKYKLVITGSEVGSKRYSQKLLARKAANVIFAGFRTGTDLRVLYEKSALFVHPSHMEGYALVVGEALCAGAPVLVSDIPPHREFGLENQCYVPVADIAALACALAVKDYSIYYSAAAVARQRADSWDRVSYKYSLLYNDLISESAI